MSIQGRERLKFYWGPETVLKCCRYWKTHNYQPAGKCGICKENPVLVFGLSWDDADAEAENV